MSAPVTTCETCRQGITDDDLATGSAVRILGKSFCARCKARAIDTISLEDLGKPTPKKPIPVRQTGGGPPKPAAAPKPVAGPSPAKAAPPPKPPDSPPPKSLDPARDKPLESPRGRPGVEIVEIDIPDTLPPPAEPAKPEPPAAKPAPERPAPPRRRAAPRAAPRSRAPLFVGLGLAVVGVAAAVGLILVSGKNGAAKPPVQPDGGTAETGDTRPPPPGDSREERARDAFAKAQTAASRSDASYDEILAALDQAREACRGTPFEQKLETLRNKVLRERETIAAQKEYHALLEELKAAVTADREFKRYGELKPKFQQARDLAARMGAGAVVDVQQLQQEYTGRYEKEAAPHYERINEGATVLAAERRFDDALKMIDTFPAYLRHSGAWRELERLRQDIERRKRN